MPEKKLTAAIWQGKCPRCRQGSIFKYPGLNLSKFSQMNQECPVCGVSFEPEPGFYFGAMFVSYALNVVLFVVVGLTLYFLLHPSDVVYVVVIGLAALLLTPSFFRLSRILFLHWFGGYRYHPPE
jgi:uncharacterized protein (DUF983 family)